ncbi:MAG: ribokinase [Planctomycetaceae bacterium]|nr:ribokinase [Planctomycetaceae bacterium]
MGSPQIVVVGSTNTDLVVTVPRIPRPGETVLGGDLRHVAGGKGANQAVAASRLGGSVLFIGRIGQDEYGRQAVLSLQAEDIDARYLLVTPGVASGIALISIQAGSGENSIVVAPGANSALCPADITNASEAIQAAQVLVVSLEIPQETVQAAISLARGKGRLIILNPAPARALPIELLAQVDVLTPNEKELEMLGGSSVLLAAGVGTVVTTLGSRGARIETLRGMSLIPAPPVTAIDTVAAGDCFTGALAVELGQGTEIDKAVRFAVAAASLKVTRQGAQAGMPTRDEVTRFLSRLNET